MKKVIIGLVTALSFVGAKAQDSNVLSAWEYMSVYTTEKQNGNMAVAIENLIRAKEAIDAASVNEKTMFKSKTWKRRADVYIKIMVEKDPGLAAQKKNLLDELYTSIEKAKTVELNEKTGKPKVFEETELFDRARYLADTLFKTASALYVAENFSEAGKYFEKRYNLFKSFDVVDTTTYTNMFLSAYKAKEFDKALEIGNNLIKMGSDDPNMYGTIARIYTEKGDAAKGLQVIKDARIKYPKNTEFITEELNYYLSTGDNTNAVKVMDEAIAAFQSQPEMLKTLYFNSGVIFAQLGDKPKSIEYYQKALAIDPKYFGALNNMAAVMLDEANTLIKEANGLPMSEAKKYDELKAKANSIYSEAAKLLENAYQTAVEISGNEKEDGSKRAYYTKQAQKLKATLYEIFFKLQDEAKMDKYKE